eukprot:TRINITY_DN9023_c0_g1_i1.p1 TRINITY_DN9023_c0_g1~~TRINITY_DN9023_c0_g1_i1.p1  ORF type:complete len:302 (-),score=17.18 TRINITY_DN9023_c0_g1_i1:287-1192(-)
MPCAEECQEQIFQYNLLISGFFTLAALMVSLYQVVQHLKHYSNPYFQDRIMAILMMSPIYALSSFLSNIWMDSAHYLVALRDIYEAFFIYYFFTLLLAYLSFENNTINMERVYLYLEHKRLVHHLFPLTNVISPYRIQNKDDAMYFLRWCKIYILQYTILKPLSAFLDIALVKTDAGPFMSFLVKNIANFSVCFSLYYLIMFFAALDAPLKPFNPLLKFLSVKVTLFFTFWQQLAIGMVKPEILLFFDSTVPNFNGDHITLSIEVTKSEVKANYERILLSALRWLCFRLQRRLPLATRTSS